MANTLRLIADSGQLKPEVRLGLAFSEFGRGLEREQKLRFDELRRSNQAPQQSDVIKLCEDVNTGIKRTSKNGGGRHKPYGTWIQTTLTSLQNLASVGDVLVGGSQNFIACGVWAALRTTLLFSVTYISLFEKVAEVLMRAGRSASMHQALVKLFGSQEPILRDMVCEYLIVMTELCRSLVTYTSKTAVVRIVTSLEMGKELQGFEDRLNVWATLINEQIQVLRSQVAVEMSSKLSLAEKSQRFFHRSQDRERERWHCLELIRSLSEHQQDFDRAWRRQLRKGSVRWIFDNPNFREWGPDPVLPGPWLKLVLFITGGLGMGKSVAMANIVSRLMKIDGLGVSYFFVERSSLSSLDGEVVLRSIAHQLAKYTLEASLRKHVAPPSALATSRASLESLDLRLLIGDAISHGRKVGIGPHYVVLDGLDQLQHSEVWYIVSTLLRVMNDSHLGELRMCISTRSVSILRARINNEFSTFHPATLKLSPEKNTPELFEFVGEELRDRPGFQELSQGTQAQIQESIWALADGMYLWASLQIEHLFPRLSRKTLSQKDIVGLLEHLPEPLSDLFDSAIASIIDNKNQPTIFQLVIGAKRRPSLSELLVAVSVPQRSSEWNENLIPSCHDAATFVYECSGGLLELDIEDQTLHFVHNSVYYHLTDAKKDWSRLLQPSTSPAGLASKWETSATASDLCWAKVCLTYLDLPIHERQVAQAPPGSKIPGAKISSSQALATMQMSLGEQSSVIKYAERIMRPSQRTPTIVSVDLTKVAQQYLEDQKRLRSKLDRGGTTVEPAGLLDYAKSHWLEHSDHFLFDVEDEYADDSLARPFWKVLRNNCTAEIDLPFSEQVVSWESVIAQDDFGDPSYASVALFEGELMSLYSALDWSIQHSHMRLFWVLLEIFELKITSQVHLHGTLRQTGKIVQRAFERQRSCTDFGLYLRLPVNWGGDPSVVETLGLPFLRACCQPNSRDEGREELELDAMAIIESCLLPYGHLPTRYVVQARMWEYFQNPLLQDLPRWKYILGRIGSFHTEIRLDAMSCRHISKLRNWIIQESEYGPSATIELDCQHLVAGLLEIESSAAFKYFAPMLLRSWEEGHLKASRCVQSWLAELADLLRGANAPCHLPDPEGLTPLGLWIEQVSSSKSYGVRIPQCWITCEGCPWSAHRPGTAGLALVVLCNWLVDPGDGIHGKTNIEHLTDLIEKRCQSGVVTVSDVFGHSKPRITLPKIRGLTGVVGTMVKSMNSIKEQVVCVSLSSWNGGIELIVYETATHEERRKSLTQRTAWFK